MKKKTNEDYPKYKQKVLLSVKQILSTESKWLKGNLTNKYNQHCLLSAIRNCKIPELYSGAELQIQIDLLKHKKKFESLVLFNDAPETRYDDIINLLNKEIEK